MVRLFLIALPLAALLGGCKTQSDLYCGAHPDVCTSGGPTDGSNGSNDTSCHSPADCTAQAEKSVCDTALNGGTCVACTTADTHACPGEVCKNDVCQVCTKHADCSSHACLVDGTCAKATDVAYVRPTGSGSGCTDAAPCKTIHDALAANKPIIKVEGAITDNAATTIDGKSVQILADTGSTLSRMNPGTILDVRNDGADVRIYDLEITGGSGMKSDPMISLSASGNPKLTLTRVNVHDNAGIGILASSGTLTLSRCTIGKNAGGGISLTAAQFDITNSFIVGNGGAIGTDATTLSAISLNNTNTGTRKLEFNTITNNNIATGLVSGVLCSIAQSAAFSNNIVYDNNSGTGKSEIGGNCSWTYSDIGDSSATQTVDGTGNANMDPSFVTPGTDYHLKADSPVRNMADPGATLNIDFDGDTRPQDGRSDMGADEFKLPP